MSEKAVLDRTTTSLIQRNIGYLVADDGYTDLRRTQQLAQAGLLLITPAIGATGANGSRYVEYLNHPELQACQSQRQVAIEPIFDLLKMLLSTPNNHKQLPVSGKANVMTFLVLGVMLVKLAMLINSIWRLPLRNVTHLIILFR